MTNNEKQDPRKPFHHAALIECASPAPGGAPCRADVHEDVPTGASPRHGRTRALVPSARECGPRTNGADGMHPTATAAGAAPGTEAMVATTMLNLHGGTGPARGPRASGRPASMSAGVLETLRSVDVPSRRAVAFATVAPIPTTGQRRQSYLALEAIRGAMACQDPKGSLVDVLDGRRPRIARSDRARVQAAALDVLALAPEGTALAAADLDEAVAGLSDAGRALQPGRDYPRVLLRLPAGQACFAEVHSARKAGCEDDAWMNGRIASHLHLGAAVPGFAGVLVFAVRSRHPIHVAADGARHEVGGCATCEQVTQ